MIRFGILELVWVAVAAAAVPKTSGWNSSVVGMVEALQKDTPKPRILDAFRTKSAFRFVPAQTKSVTIY
jgi:hypothetical protein